MFAARKSTVSTFGSLRRTSANTTAQIRRPHSTWNTMSWECENSTESTGLASRNMSVSVRPAKKNATYVTAMNTRAVLRSGCLSTSAKGTMNSRAGTTKVFTL